MFVVHNLILNTIGIKIMIFKTCKSMDELFELVKHIIFVLQNYKSFKFEGTYNSYVLTEKLCVRKSPVSEQLVISEYENNYLGEDLARIKRNLFSDTRRINVNGTIIYNKEVKFETITILPSFSGITFTVPVQKDEYFNLSLQNDISVPFEFLEEIQNLASYLDDFYGIIVISG